MADLLAADLEALRLLAADQAEIEIDLRARIRSARRRGGSVREIAAAAGCSPSTVQRITA